MSQSYMVRNLRAHNLRAYNLRAYDRIYSYHILIHVSYLFPNADAKFIIILAGNNNIELRETEKVFI